MSNTISRPCVPSPLHRFVVHASQARNSALMRSNQAKDRATVELREGSKILEDQLRLMDEKVRVNCVGKRRSLEDSLGLVHRSCRSTCGLS